MDGMNRIIADYHMHSRISPDAHDENAPHVPGGH